ncbi:MAG: signal recognition particle-docking protein FtsY [Candidatus Aenigmarchaeota archaeon]|nr:signal recognition particle-docking protein FtsY [Candidatus Aenigmarchaeota archaeon]MDW8159955.1 signal recognition particle-docking protein FtsY [Candidatus Aenigmarchaeota archaeon]
MFDFLKKKLKNFVEKISKKVEDKDVESKKVEEKVEKENVKRKKLIEKLVPKKILTEDDVKPFLEDLQIDLIEADVAYEVSEKIKKDLLGSLVSMEIKKGEEKKLIKDFIRKSLFDILNLPKVDLVKEIQNKKPYLIVFFGFNGSGKTTTIAKVAKYLKDKGFKCVLAAADTFRAASIEQLEIHAKKIGVDLVKQKYGADPAAVIFDAKKHAEAKRIDVVLADTSGRSYSNENLMEELKKIVRVNKPDLKVLVVDSLTGNDAVNQAKYFGEIGVDAVVFTKLDVNEKGGAILTVSYILKKPILFVCNGQGYNDIKEFDAKEFIDNLLEE